MNIETLRIKNFKALRDVTITNLPAYCGFVGRNGTGKTTIFRVFAFLKNCLVPGVADITVTVTEDGRLLMCYRDGKFVDPFIDRNVSFGWKKSREKLRSIGPLISHC